MAVIDIATSGRPCPGEDVSGDCHNVTWAGSTCRIAIFDGLGHGPDAASAASTARAELAAQPALGPIDAIVACHDALRGSRGAAISVVQVDPFARRLVGAGVGNVDVHVKTFGKCWRFVADRGIVGYRLPTIHPVEIALDDEWLLIVNSDGVSSQFGLDALSPQTGQETQRVADEIVRRWARERDDVTVVVAAPRART